jgi:hypothetical protein
MIIMTKLLILKKKYQGKATHPMIPYRGRERWFPILASFHFLLFYCLFIKLGPGKSSPKGWNLHQPVLFSSSEMLGDATL